MPPRSVLAALLALTLAWAALLFLWPDAVLALTFDDAFYYFEIGQRMAAGEGSTFDGLHQTNGYHPLWVLPCAAVHAVLPAGDFTVRLLLALQAGMVFAGLGWALSGLRWSRAAEGAAVLAAVVLTGWLAVPMITRTAVNGLESAVVVAVHAGLLALTLRHDAIWSWPASRRWALGGLLALSILSRTDGALLTPLLLLWVLPDAWRARQWANLIPIGLPPALTLAAFLAANQTLFGTPMQVSGTLKRVPLTLSGGLILAVCGLAAVAVTILVRRGAFDRMPNLSHVARNTGWYVVFGLAITAYYTGMQTFARQWYFAPVVLWATVALVAGVLDLAAKARSDAPDATPFRALAPLGGIFVLPLLACAVWTGWQLAAPETLAVRKADRDAAVWLDEHLPPGTRLGSWDAGLVGYVTDQPIINLDGVVNDVGWLRALGEGGAGERLVEVEGVRFIVNHSVYNDGDCETITEALERLGAPPPAEVLATWRYEQVGRLNGGPYGRHAMATCVVRLDR